MSSRDAPPPTMAGLPLFDPSTRRYELIIRQQPRQGRQCGFGIKDKRPLDPLPIIQLKVFNPDGTLDDGPNLVMQVSLNRVESSTSEPQPTMLVSHTAPDAAFPNTRMLEGRLVSSAHLVRDLDGSKACFFVFTDLSIRLEGSFTLLFQLVHLGPVVERQGGRVVAQIETEAFRVYSPRRFPGMTESTELAKALARQGVQVPIRNDVRKKQT